MKIILKIIDYGILVPCYVGNWSDARGATIELHKFWFSHDDHNYYVGGKRSKYTIGRPDVLSIWHVQERTYLIQNEVTTLEKASFFLIKKLKCHPRNLFGDDAYVLANKPTNADSWP